MPVEQRRQQNTRVDIGLKESNYTFYYIPLVHLLPGIVIRVVHDI